MFSVGQRVYPESTKLRTAGGELYVDFSWAGGRLQLYMPLESSNPLVVAYYGVAGGREEFKIFSQSDIQAWLKSAEILLTGSAVVDKDVLGEVTSLMHLYLQVRVFESSMLAYYGRESEVKDAMTARVVALRNYVYTTYQESFGIEANRVVESGRPVQFVGSRSFGTKFMLEYTTFLSPDYSAVLVDLERVSREYTLPVLPAKNLLQVEIDNHADMYFGVYTPRRGARSQVMDGVLSGGFYVYKGTLSVIKALCVVDTLILRAEGLYGVDKSKYALLLEMKEKLNTLV